MPVDRRKFDVAVIGQGILGLAHALAARRAGKSVVVIDRHYRSTGASIRNFGFVTVTGQSPHLWPLARRSRDIWQQVSAMANIPILQTGLALAVRRPAAAAVLEAFMTTAMGEECQLLTDAQMRALDPDTPFAPCAAVLVSPHELRVEARTAIPAIAQWLQQDMGVTFADPASVISCEPQRVVTAHEEIHAETIFVCPGDDLTSLFPELMKEQRVTRCKLQMMRLAAVPYRLARPVMSDLSLVRYQGYARLPAATELESVLQAEQASHLRAGIHLIAVQSADGSLVVGDSHDYDDAPDPFAHHTIERLILQEFSAVLGAPPPVIERWTGTYASSLKQDCFSCEVRPGVHVSLVTTGAGMSSAFAFAEDAVGAAFNTALRPIAHV